MIKNAKSVPLNIVMSYPVRWSRFQILRDFVQNFYDSVGYDEWKNRFHYEYKESMLTMSVNDVSFSYEWLMHIGASTKTANSDKYAGYFGEGFKIAALCAYRDMKWKISMFSDDWQLEVSSCQKTIEDSVVEMLSYDILPREKSNETKLLIEYLSYEDYEIFKTVLNSFYYPENPIMGKLIWKGKEGAVYLRSKNSIDRNLPSTHDFESKGAVFCGYQMLGTNPFDLVVCLHRYRKEDRERKALYPFDVIDVFKSISYYIDSKGAMVMLEKMRRYWNSYPHGKIDFYSWSPVIDTLIRQVAVSESSKKEFVSKYNYLLCIDLVKTVAARNRRWQARSWLEQQDQHYLLVKDTFTLLGYKTLEEVCEQNGGFVVDEDPDERQKRCFSVLEELCKSIFDGFFIVDRWPEAKIIANIRASYHGMAVSFKKKKPVVNNRGLSIRYDVTKIYLKTFIFSKACYYDGVATYIHELCHMFGGDSSSAFSVALTHAIETLAENNEKVLKAKEAWERIFEEA